MANELQDILYQFGVCHQTQPALFVPTSHSKDCVAVQSSNWLKS
jgi:hypothetical protein